MRKLVFIFVAALMLAACDSSEVKLARLDPQVELVRQGTLNGHENVTIGKAFETAFGEGKWTSFETAKGTKVVEFNGRLGKNFPYYDDYHKVSYYTDADVELLAKQYYCNDSLKVQFTINLDGASFEVAYSSRPYGFVENYAYSETGLYAPLECLNVESFEFTDPRDGQSYKAKTMPDGRIWMTHNLNFEMQNSWSNSDYPCLRQPAGRLYTWNAAMAACPDGWHLPREDEFETLKSLIPRFPHGFRTLDFFGFDSYCNECVMRGGSRHTRDYNMIWTAVENDAGKVCYMSDDPYRNDIGLSCTEDRSEIALTVRCIKDYDEIEGEAEDIDYDL